MYVIFLIWQCPGIQVIAIHAFHKIYLNIKMPDLEVKTKIFWWDDRDICKLNNSASNLKQIKKTALKFKTLSARFQNSCLNL